ncbi:glycosyltransferase family 2 protein [Candidatus Saccharibacteria bacterium]|nr:glycosyltransferase family 2 protein [Candidatus Saccharibacteria bacterium]
MNKPLISVIVTTYNNTATLDACLTSIANQSYTQIETIVVDNNSTDDTKQIARAHTDKVYNIGPERCTQRNFGVSKADGNYVMIIDSDMELGKNVVRACVKQIAVHTELKALVIPEESFGQGFWAQCKRLERSFYVGTPWMEAARFFDTQTYLAVGGYDERLISGEDWDLSQRVSDQAPTGRIDEYIRHNEGHLHLLRTLKKKYYYAQKFARYIAVNKDRPATSSQTGILTRYGLFFSRPYQLFRRPDLGLGMLFMKTSEFAVGGFGYLRVRLGGRSE